MKKLEKKYNFAEVEKKWQKYWQDNNIFKFDWNDIKDRNKIYAIDTPPPHVSGALHMGHIFGYSQMDVIARFQRMLGKNVFYPVGFDDNGLPSERYVEKKIGKKSKSMERSEFVKICDKEIQDAEQFMKGEFIKMNYSFDFDSAYRTISPVARKVSQMSFLDLYKKGYVYRKEEPVIWDVVDQTALAQTEAEDAEVESQMNYITFTLSAWGSGINGKGLNKYSYQGSENILFKTKNLYTKEINPNSDEEIQFLVDLHNDGDHMKCVGFPNGLNTTFEKEKELVLKNQNTLDEKILCYSNVNNQIIGYCKIGIPDNNNIIHIDYKIKKDFWGNGFGYEIVSNLINYIFNTLKLDVTIRTNPNILNIASIKICEKCGFEKTGIFETFKDTNNEDYKCQIMELNKNNFQSPIFNFQLNTTLIPQRGAKDSEIVIMTTRPELLPACVALFVHPDENKKYEGMSAITPLGVEVPILLDESVEKDKGTGVMMCCTFGDKADVEKYKKYKLPLKIIINEKGCLYFDNVPEINEKYKNRLDGLFTTKAREEILKILEEENKIAKSPEKIIHNVKVGERSKSALEIIVKKQWNINVLNIKEELHKKASEIKWHPDWMENRIHSWIDGLNWDWCISRQRFFGVPVPCWYSKRKGEEGKVILPNIEDLPVDPTTDLPRGYTTDEAIGETDVFDTWMTSSVSPQLSIQGINEDLYCDKKRFETLDLPFDLRPQGHDIIRTWAFCTIVKALYHENKIPWKDIFINGFCLASDGTKMSKSKGNGVDPVKTVNEFGADAVRYWALNSQLGTDTNYSTDMIKIGQKLITKLFNSAKFAEINFENLRDDVNDIKQHIDNGLIFETIDLWIISKIKSTVSIATKSLESFEYSKALEIIEDFFWNDFCDNYLEIIKGRAYGLNFLTYKGIEISTISQEEQEKIVKGQQSAIRTVYYVFNYILKLFAPFMPAICEEIYSSLYEEEFEKTKSISSRGNWVDSNIFIKNEDVENIGNTAVQILAEVRKYKSEKNISIKEIIENITVHCDCNLANVIEDLKNVCNVNDINVVNDKEFKIEF